jgi:hypothetical protein
MDVKTTSSLTLAAAAAAMFALAPISASAGDAEMKCVGGNACKGQSACKTAGSECKGLNGCKGQGFVMATKAACEEAGGTIEEG